LCKYWIFWASRSDLFLIANSFAVLFEHWAKSIFSYVVQVVKHGH
jgi:hypothetical protein